MNASKPKNIRLVLLFTLLSIIAGLAIIPYELTTMGDIFSKASIPIFIICLIQIVQMAIMAFITSFIGLKLANKVGLDAKILRAWVYRLEKPTISKEGIIQAIVLAVIGSCVTLAFEYFIFRPNIPQISMNTHQVDWWKGLLTVFYGGIFEEILVRLFIMSLIVWVLFKLFSKGEKKPKNFIYWIGIIGAALLFGAGHLPATIAVFGDLTPLLLIRAFLLNGLLGIVFGYLYWKKGLEYAMFSHAIGDIVFHVIVGS